MCPTVPAAPYVQTEHRIRLRIVEGAFFEHERRTALFSAGCSLLSRLKDELHCSRQLILHPCEDFRDAHENGHVRVVTARVHHADFLTVVGRFHLRSKRHAHLFGDRQSVHVCTKRNHLARLAASKDTDDAGVRDAGANLDAETSQMIGHDLRRACFTIPQLRMLVNVTTPGDHLASDLFFAPIDLCRQRTLRTDGVAEKHQQKDAANDVSHGQKHKRNKLSESREPRLGRRTALTFPLLPPPQKN